jgi:hypothetical protein
VLIECTDDGLFAALDQIAADAWRREGDPSFPADSVEALARVGALGLGNLGGPSMNQWVAVRAVAAADPVVGRIIERHLEAVDHLLRHAPEPLRSDELDCVGAGERVLGVWDEDDDEAAPAEIRGDEVHGVKLHAVGAGGLDRAVILVRGPGGSVAAAYADVREHVEVDRSWRVLRGEPMSAGERVEISGAPILTMLPAWSPQAGRALHSRAELRRVAAWMGVVDSLSENAMDSLAERDTQSEEEALAAGRMAAARRTLDLWLADAARQADADPDADMTAVAAQTRAAIAVIAGSVLAESVLATEQGTRSPAFARARRELARVPGIERPDSALASAGRELLRRRRSRG